MNVRVIPTPARAAHLRSAVDRRDPRLTTMQALGIIAAVYLLFFGEGIFRAVHAYLNGAGGGYEDYSTLYGQAVLVRASVEIVGAVTVLYLVCRWLEIPRGLAGIPRRHRETLARGDRRIIPPSTWPAMATIALAVVGALGAIAVDLLLTPADRAVTSTNMALADNGISLVGGAVRSLNAGIVEEIVIVALPVLIGRRAGWHPAAIIALSVALRWPYHVYHGLWSTIPWVIVWGGLYAAAYMYLRRLWPLILVHTCQDLLAFYADTATPYLIVACLVLILPCTLGLRSLINGRRRERTTTVDGQTIRYRRYADDSVRITKPAAEKIPDLWAVITTLRSEVGSRRARLRLVLGPRSEHVPVLAARGHRWRRWNPTWVSLAPPPVSEAPRTLAPS